MFIFVTIFAERFVALAAMIRIRAIFAFDLAARITINKCSNNPHSTEHRIYRKY